MTLSEFDEALFKPMIGRLRARMRRELASDLRRIRAVDPALARRWYLQCRDDLPGNPEDDVRIFAIISPFSALKGALRLRKYECPPS